MTADLNLLPTPQFLASSSHVITLSRDSSLEIVTGSNPAPKVSLAAGMIEEYLHSEPVRFPGKVSIVEQPTEADGRILLCDPSKQHSIPVELTAADREAIHAFGQGYVLRTCDNNCVCICGLPQGVLYGAMTLLQLLEPAESGLCIPGIYIRDFPHFESRCASDWLTNAEGNRSSMDRGQGWQGFEELCKRKIDQCLRYKINAILFDGFGWSLAQRDPQYPRVVRRICRHARQRGIHLSFGGYGAGYGMTFQKGPLYEDARYLGQVFRNQEYYPDGPVYPCTGETRARAVRKGMDTRILGTCRSNQALNQLKAQELQDFVRAVEPGMLYIHHEDYGTCRNTQAAWLARCDRCRQRWPNDDVTAADGAAGSIAEGYSWLINAVNEVKNPSTGYDAVRDCQILLVSPVYCLSERTPAAWNEMLRFWQNAGTHLPRSANVMVCFREAFPLDSDGVLWTESFNAAMRDAGLNLGSIMFFITGGDHWLNDYPFVAGCALNHLFLGARAILHDNGNAYQEPLQLLNAEYTWNVKSTGYAPRPDTYVKTWELWIALSENESRPEAIYGESGLLHRACAKLYGQEIAGVMARYFSVFRRLQDDAGNQEGIESEQDVAPERVSYLPMTSNKIHPLPVLWRALAIDSKTWGSEIDNERMLAELDRLKIDRLELHRRLRRRWTLTSEMFEQGEHLLSEALSLARSESVREELEFLLNATQTKLPLTMSLSKFHSALQEIVGASANQKQAQSLLADALSDVQKASSLAQHHYPSIVDPVGEVGALKTYLARLETAIRERITA